MRILIIIGLILMSTTLYAISYTYKILEIRIGANSNSNKTVEALIKFTSTEDSEFEKTKWIVFESTSITALLQLKNEIDSKIPQQ